MHEPVGHHLGEALGLEVQENIRDDISTAQHTLQAVRFQHAVEFWQQVKNKIHKSNVDTHTQLPSFTRIVKPTQLKKTIIQLNLPIHHRWEVLR